MNLALAGPIADLTPHTLRFTDDLYFLLERHLPEYTDTAIVEAAKLEAFRARRDFYFRIPLSHEPEPRWVLEDQLLDPESEKTLFEQQKDKLRSLLGAVSMARIRIGEPH